MAGVTRTNIQGKNVGCAGGGERGGGDEQAKEATAQGTGGNIWKCHRKGRLRGGSEVKRKPSEDWWQTISALRVLDEASCISFQNRTRAAGEVCLRWRRHLPPSQSKRCHSEVPEPTLSLPDSTWSKVTGQTHLRGWGKACRSQGC